MALINGIYVHVTKESVSREADVSAHSAEEGIDITDTVRVKPKELSITGKIVGYSEYSAPESQNENTSIKAWFSLVKKNGSKFDTMSFERLNNELLAFEGGAQWVDTGNVQFLDETLTPIDAVNGSADVLEVRFEVSMPYGSTVRIQNAYTEYCAFNIINTSVTGYTIRDYSCDDEISDIVLSNTDNGVPGRVKTTYSNLYIPETQSAATEIKRSAYWVIQQLTAIWESGALITYEGRNALEGYQIKTFESDHDNANAGGADFSMTIREFRAGRNSYTENDAAISSGSVQQIQAGDNEEVKYIAQLGDSVYNLVEAENAPYKNLKREAINGKEYSAMDWIMAKNPNAFDTQGDFDTFKADVEIIVGTR